MSPQAALHGENPSGEGTCSLGEKEVGRQQLFYVLGFEVVFGRDGWILPLAEPQGKLQSCCFGIVPPVHHRTSRP